MRYVIISAMPEELSALVTRFEPKLVDSLNGQDIYFYQGEHEYYFLNCGIGKVNAAITTSLFLTKYEVDHIISIGTAGGVNQNLEVTDFVLADKIGYHDVDVTAFGYKKGQVPGQELFFKVDSGDWVKNLLVESKINYHVGLILSGDSFINSKNKRSEIESDFSNVYALEMESAAIAHVANSLEINITIIRAISDLAHGESTIEFNKYLEIATQGYVKLIECLDAM